MALSISMASHGWLHFLMAWLAWTVAVDAVTPANRIVVAGQISGGGGQTSDPSATTSTNVLPLPEEARLYLNSRMVAMSRQDGSFELPVTWNASSEGQWFLHVSSKHYRFPAYRILFVGESREPDALLLERLMPAVEFLDPHPVLEERSRVPFVAGRWILHALNGVEQPLNFYTARESFSLLSMLMNPMFLMMAFSLGMLFVLPKMMENMDPDQMREIQENQRTLQQSGDLTERFAQLLATRSDSRPVASK